MDMELVIWNPDFLGEIDIPDSGLTWRNPDLYWINLYSGFETYLEELGLTWRKRRSLSLMACSMPSLLKSLILRGFSW